MLVQRLLADFGRLRRPKTAPLASDDAAQLHERRAGELKRLNLSVQRPLSKLGRPSLQSLYERTLAAQVRADPDPTRHITDKSVVGWKRDMSVLVVVQQVFTSAGRAAIEGQEQEHEPAAAGTLPHKVLLTRRFIMKIAFLLNEWGLDWTRTNNFDETCLSLSPTGSHSWWWKGKNRKPQFQRPTKQAVTVTLVTSAVRAQVAAQRTCHGTTERVVPDLTTDVWMTCSHNHWASKDTLRQLFSKREAMVHLPCVKL